MSTEETGLPLDMLAILPDDQTPAQTVTASSLTRTVRATMPSKRRKYDTSEAIDELYREHADSLKQGKAGLYEKVVFGIYAVYKPRIIKIARKYRSLSPIFGEEDLQQEAYRAILQALRSYRHSPDILMKFASYLEWSIRNKFQRSIGSKDKYVEIYARDGTFVKTMGYGKFVGKKKALEESGHTHTTKNRFCYLSEVLMDEDLEARLNEGRFAPYEYPGQTPERPKEMRETEAGEQEEGEEPETQTPGNGAASGNGLGLQMIDGLYRQWARTRPVVNEGDPFVLRIYDLCRQESEAFFLPSGNNGAALSGGEVERSALSAIVRSLARHDDNSVPRIPFSMFLRVAMRRSMGTLRKDKADRGG